MKLIPINCPADEAMSNMFSAVRKSGMTFTKAEASKILGGRRAVERYVREGFLTKGPSGDYDNSRWTIPAEQVLRLACNMI